ncbi:hypothetical protein MMC14_006574 [Varicellaria rhodocarpa]|nr:hypothetical protein [Varicellaria rhodocarpa]
MRSSPRDFLSLCLSLIAILPTSTAVDLSQFQQINGFSPACTNAYNTPIPGCSPLDFASNRPCSNTCIAGLQTITSLLNSACAGTQADPSSLIGHFFQGTGVTALCPNAAAATTDQASPSQQSTTTTLAIVSFTRPSSSTSTLLVTSTTSSIIASTDALSSPTSSLPTSTSSIDTFLLTSASNAQSQQSTETSALSSSTSASTTFVLQSSPGSTDVVATPATLSTSPTPATTTATNVFVKTVVNDGSATVLTSKAQQTASDNPDAFGGGGSPFEISSNADHITTIPWISMGVLCWFMLAIRE